MDSIAERLLIFTSIALITLTGCSQQKTDSALEPPGSSSNASTAVASNSTSATPQETEHYSGGSKAPEGEYRPADKFGPAQNVPKPIEPEGMNVETIEGLEKFIKYWQDSRNYAYQTGDTDTVKTLVESSFTQEQGFYDAVEEVYKSGGWVIGGELDIHYDRSLIIPFEDGEYSVGSNFEVKDSVLWYGNETTYNDNSDSIYDSVDLRIKFENGAWKVKSTKIISGY